MENPPQDFLSRDACARFLGMSTSNFDKRMKSHIPNSARCTVKVPHGKALYYHGPTVIRTWHEQEMESVGADPDLAGPDSPNLERLRGIKADLAYRDLLERDGKLLTVEWVHEYMGAVAACYRRLGEQLRDRHPDVFPLYEQCVDSICNIRSQYGRQGDGDE